MNLTVITAILVLVPVTGHNMKSASYAVNMLLQSRTCIYKLLPVDCIRDHLYAYYYMDIYVCPSDRKGAP